MIARALLISACVLASSAALVVRAQDQRPSTPPAATGQRTPQPATAPAPVAAVPAAPAPVMAVAPPAREGQPVNIKVDLTITDQRGGSPVFKKTVTVVTADGLSGFIRSTARYQSIGEVPLNIDAQPRLLADGKIRLSVNLQYDLPAAPDPSDVRAEERRAGPLTKTSIHENLALVLESGKSLIAAQSADPVGDRQVMIEVKATVLK